ncbi:MAG TPA: alkaline phosphatase family protein [Terriglobales bacterium]|nr:alkaline phosphatase family protein [Terriglobales bacterium]
MRNSPLWESSMFIITWDEHGGFYDHVVSPGQSSPATGPHSLERTDTSFGSLNTDRESRQ